MTERSKPLKKKKKLNGLGFFFPRINVKLNKGLVLFTKSIRLSDSGTKTVF